MEAHWQDAAARTITALAGPGTSLRDDQYRAVAALMTSGAKVLVVQATGWGKSAVYWCATAARRHEGHGPTLVVSPLLALMRDQVAAATSAGLSAATINSANVEQWDHIEQALARDELDVILVSPERLANPQFGRRVLASLAGRMGLLVIDEAHAISDWGHDFRPDYRRVTDVLARLDVDVPVLATTATANARVTADVAAQLGETTTVLRGPLHRDSLQLVVTPPLAPLARHAWIAENLPGLPGSGIVYALTIAEAERATAAIRAVQGPDYPVATYTGRLEAPERARLEEALRSNEIKALVATSALGMGYDKPDLGFVVHLGSPPSPVSYYQQVGRAGRGIDHALVVLLPSPGDEGVWRHFATATLPQEQMARRLLAELDAHLAPDSGEHPNDTGQARWQGDPWAAEPSTLASATSTASDQQHRTGSGESMTVPALEAATGIRRGRVELLLRQLAVDGAVMRADRGWAATGRPWHYDAEHYRRIVAIREREAAIMRDYIAGRGCLMQLLASALDDESAGPCGRCSVCLGQLPDAVASGPSQAAVAAVGQALRGSVHVLEPRRMWPGGQLGRRGRISADESAQAGRVLIEFDAPEWESALAACRYAPGDAPAELLDALIDLMRRWAPTWVSRPEVVIALTTLGATAEAGFGGHGVGGQGVGGQELRYPLADQAAAHIAGVGGLEAASWPVVAPRWGDERPSGAAEAAAWQRQLDAVPVPERLVAPGTGRPQAGSVLLAQRCVLLVVDATASGWPVTLAAASLRRAGAAAVLPLVIHREP